MSQFSPYLQVNSSVSGYFLGIGQHQEFDFCPHIEEVTGYNQAVTSVITLTNKYCYDFIRTSPST